MGGCRREALVDHRLAPLVDDARRRRDLRIAVGADVLSDEVEEAAAILQQRNLDVDLQIDGGINNETAPLASAAGIRTLVAMAWIAAGFLYELGVTLEWPEVRLLARMGGWVPHKNRPPGKIAITRGLSRLIEWMTADAFLNQYIAEHGGLPPRIAAFIGRKPSGERL